jgi:DNA-binding response OmpR family regulator
MNDPPSDGNESVIDIFVLSVSETVVPLFTEHLEKKGYRVTLFTDGTYLLETLRTGKPNLLICDTTTLDEEGFEVCRQIKSDDDLWVIPVLILTSASTLTDLLQVLDCNADNFIPHPFDLSYSLSIIEGMLGTPVERQTPDQIKTQFKISHDDRIYVVAANRRKLLEFLLSSFEIGVTKSSELSHIRTELQTLSESAIQLEDYVTEQTRFIDTIKANLQQKEQKVIALTHDVEEKRKLLTQKTDEIEQFSEKLDHHKALIVTYDSNIRTLIQEKKDIETAYCSEIEALRQQIAELSNEVDTTKTSFDIVQGNLEEERIHCTSLECTLDLLVQQKELAEKSLLSITGEHEQLIAAFEAEKNRAICAEQELAAVMQAKTQSEQDLSLIITALNETKIQQAADLSRLKDGLETESCQRISAEIQVESLRGEKEQLETSLRSITGEHERLIAAFEAEKNRAICTEQELAAVLQGKTQSEQELTGMITALNETKTQQAADLTRLKSELETESCQRISAEDQVESLQGDKEQLETSLRSITGEHELLTAAFEAEKNRAICAEQELAAVMQGKTQSERELTGMITALSETKTLQDEYLTRLKGELEREAGLRVSAENQAESLRVEKEQSETSLRSSVTALQAHLDELQGTLQTTSSALKNEENTTQSLKENLAENERLARALTLEHERLKSAYSEEEKRARSAEQELETLLQTKTESEQELVVTITALNETKTRQEADLARMRGELEREGERRTSAENQLGSLQQDKEHLETSLRSSVTVLKEQLQDLRAQLESTRAALEDEQNTTKLLKENLSEAVAENEKTETRVKSDLESYKTTFLRLKHDLAEATAIPKTLERDLDALKIQNRLLADELNLANQSRAQSVQQVRSLGDELEKMKAALDAERSLHQAGDKSLGELKETVQCLEQNLRSSAEEQDNLNRTLDNERRLRLIAEDASKAAAQEQEQLRQELCAVTDERDRQEHDRALKIQGLEKEFEQVYTLQRSLEGQVTILTREKLEAERKVKSLTDEIDQARTALADEWVDHMEVNETLAAVCEEPLVPEQPLAPKKETMREIVAKEPDLPVVVRSSFHSIATVVTSDLQNPPVPEYAPASPETPERTPEVSPEASPEIVTTFCDKDLFEEDEPVFRKAEPSQPPQGVTEPGPEKTAQELPPEFPVSDQECGKEAFPVDDEEDEDAGEEPEEDWSGKISGEPGMPSPHVVFSFNRKQWFDLLKWAHHSTTLTHDQRLQIVRMGRLIQKDRKLTRKQEEQVNEMIALVQALGYRPS